ncbi:MAG: hypothetical protein NZ700_04200 [Gemmataceae bacterium]|nr:hypothetical protein [Gemmataceae bacterium]MDW8266605.1 hypothetical protein [Gemmataceae bacterium]
MNYLQWPALTAALVLLVAGYPCPAEDGPSRTSATRTLCTPTGTVLKVSVEVVEPSAVRGDLPPCTCPPGSKCAEGCKPEACCCKKAAAAQESCCPPCGTPGPCPNAEPATTPICPCRPAVKMTQVLPTAAAACASEGKANCWSITLPYVIWSGGMMPMVPLTCLGTSLPRILQQVHATREATPAVPAISAVGVAMPIAMPSPPAWTFRHSCEGIRVTGQCLEGTCEAVHVQGPGGGLVLEGNVRLKYQKDGETAEISADKLSLSVDQGGIRVCLPTGPLPIKPAAVQPVSYPKPAIR